MAERTWRFEVGGEGSIVVSLDEAAGVESVRVGPRLVSRVMRASGRKPHKFTARWGGSERACEVRFDEDGAPRLTVEGEVVRSVAPTEGGRRGRVTMARVLASVALASMGGAAGVVAWRSSPTEEPVSDAATRRRARSTESGSSATGSAKEAGASTGDPAPTALVRCTFDPEGVYVVGSTDSTGTVATGIVDLRKPNEGCVVHPRVSVARSVAIRGADGALVYTEGASLRIASARRFDVAGAALSDTSADAVMPTAGCSGSRAGFPIDHVLGAPDDTSVAFACGESGNFFGVGGGSLLATDTRMVFGFGYGGARIGSSSTPVKMNFVEGTFVVDEHGLRHAVESMASRPSSSLTDTRVRAKRDGFWMVTWQVGGSMPVVGHRVDANGAASPLPAYPVPSKPFSFDRSAIDLLGNVYVATSFGIEKLTPGTASAVVVYTPPPARVGAPLPRSFLRAITMP